MPRFLFRPVDVATLGAFRLIWGALLTAEALSRFRHVTGIYSPEFTHFRYLMAQWVPLPTSHTFLYFECGLLTIAGLAILFGVWFRTASVTYGLTFLHLFLIDEVYYNNHFYLTVLVCFLMAMTHADRAFSIRSYRARDNDGCAPAETVASWEYWLIRGQILVLYVFGGIAKLNGDWIRGEPLRYWFSMGDQIKWPLNLFASQDWFAMMASWGGIFIDLVCPFFLLWKRTRWIAMTVFISFHLMNSRLFKIGLFPWIAIGLLVPFFAPSTARIAWGWIQRFVAGVRRIRMPELNTLSHSSRIPPMWIAAVFVVYFSIQIAVPFRHFLWGQRPDWTEVGQKFSWRMMLRNKDAYIRFVFDPPEAEDWLNANPDKRPNIAAEHITRMSEHPWMLLQYVRHLDKSLAANGFPGTEIYVHSVVSLNDHPYQVMIDPTVDLTDAAYPLWGIPEWIAPLDPSAVQDTQPLEEKDRIVAIQKGFADYLKRHPEKRPLGLGQPE